MLIQSHFYQKNFYPSCFDQWLVLKYLKLNKNLSIEEKMT